MTASTTRKVSGQTSPKHPTASSANRHVGSTLQAARPGNQPLGNLKRKASKPIINWIQRKLAGGKKRGGEGAPSPRSSSEHARSNTYPARGRSYVHGSEHGASGSGRGPAGTFNGSNRGANLANIDTRQHSHIAHAVNGSVTFSINSPPDSPRSLSPSLGPGSHWSPSMPVEADEDASIRPLPPTSPPSPTPSRSTHLTYSSYTSDPQTARSGAASTKPTTLLSIDLGPHHAHIAQAPPSITGVWTGGGTSTPNSSPQITRFPSTRSQYPSTATSITFSTLPVGTRGSVGSNLTPSDGADATVPGHSNPHPRNNPRPLSPPLDNASTLTLASSTFLRPSGGVSGQPEDPDASIRAIGPRSRRGSWDSQGSNETGWSAAFGIGRASRRTGSIRTAGSWKTGGTGGGTMDVEDGVNSLAGGALGLGLGLGTSHHTRGSSLGGSLGGLVVDSDQDQDREHEDGVSSVHEVSRREDEDSPKTPTEVGIPASSNTIAGPCDIPLPLSPTMSQKSL